MASHKHNEPESDMALRVKAIEQLLSEKGLDDPTVIELYETRVGPHNGAKVVAKAWSDPDYKARLLENGTDAIAELGVSGIQGDNMVVAVVVVENTDDVHNVVVCTLCSCYPWPVLGLPPRWYKSPPYRSRVVREPRAVLNGFGVAVPEDVEERVWDSSAEIRYMALPKQPEETKGRSEAELAQAVTREGMIGVATVWVIMDGIHGFGKIEREENEPLLHADWEARAFGLSLQAADGIGFVDNHLRANIERIPAGRYLRLSYYELWMQSVEALILEKGALTAEEIEARVATLSEVGRAEGGSETTLDEVIARGLRPSAPMSRWRPVSGQETQ